MKLLTSSTIATLIAATFVASVSRAQDVAVSVSESPMSTPAAMLDKARTVLTRYVSACDAQDRQALTRATTDDAEIQYSVNVVGQYLAADLGSADACWGSAPSMGSKAASADMRIYLTSSPDVVFVDMITADDVGHTAHKSEHLAMVRINGERIAQIRDFTTSPARGGAVTVNAIDPSLHR